MVCGDGIVVTVEGSEDMVRAKVTDSVVILILVMVAVVVMVVTEDS